MEFPLLKVNYVHMWAFVLHRMAYRTGNDKGKITYYI